MAVIGFAPLALPLASVLPQAGATCTLLTTPDVLFVHVPQSGLVDVGLPLPATPALIGQSFRQQIVAIEVDLLGAITSVTSTNGLLATIGSY